MSLKLSRCKLPHGDQRPSVVREAGLECQVHEMELLNYTPLETISVPEQSYEDLSHKQS